MKTLSDAQRAEISARITEGLYDCAVERCRQTVFYEQRLTDGADIYIENASHSEEYQTKPILPCGYRDRTSGKVRMVVFSRRCAEQERDRVFWGRYDAQKRGEFPFDDIEPIYFTYEQISELRNGELKEVIDSFLDRVSAELPRRYRKEAMLYIDGVLAGFMTAPITLDELRHDTAAMVNIAADIFFETVAMARAKYTPKRYRRTQNAKPHITHSEKNEDLSCA